MKRRDAAAARAAAGRLRADDCGRRGVSMRKFNVKLARIEASSGSRSNPLVSITFRIERGALKFQVPIRLGMRYYDDTEMVQAARDVLHRTLAEIAAQTRGWKLAHKDLHRLSGMSRRPTERKSRVKSAK
jgi:hypothetical protein